MSVGQAGSPPQRIVLKGQEDLDLRPEVQLRLSLQTLPVNPRQLSTFVPSLLCTLKLGQHRNLQPGPFDPPPRDFHEAPRLAQQSHNANKHHLDGGGWRTSTY